MAWTGNFRGVGYKKRAEFLLNYLKQRPDGLAECLKRRSKHWTQMTPEERFCYGYKDVLSFIMSSLCVRSKFRYVSTGANEQLEKHGITEPNSDHLYNKKKYTAYKGLKDSLPDGITLNDILQGKVSHSIRYDKAGLGIAKTDDGAAA